jgi:hypothetical protein
MRVRVSILHTALLTLMALAPPARGQAGGGFELSWHAVTGGGGMASQGGGFDLGGTAGQPACGNASGGAFALTGGFWNGATLAPVGVPGPPAGPRVFALRPARPNPIGDQATIEFDLPGPCFTRLEIYDLAGQRVRTLVEASLSPGPQLVVWDGRDAAGARVASGIYFAHLAAGKFHASSRIVVLH